MQEDQVLQHGSCLEVEVPNHVFHENSRRKPKRVGVYFLIGGAPPQLAVQAVQICVGCVPPLSPVLAHLDTCCRPWLWATSSLEGGSVAESQSFSMTSGRL